MRIHLVELGEPALEPLSADVVAGLAATGLVDVVPTTDAGWWEVRPGTAVGAVAVGDLEVRVAPKVDIDRIVFMLGYTLRGVRWHDDRVGVEAASDVVQALAEVFTRSVTAAIRPGLLQGYRLAEEALPVVRGRIRIDEQLKRRPGQWVPLEVAYDDFTVDIAENRILRAALEHLLRNPFVPRALRPRLAGLALQFAEVSRLVTSAPLPPWQASRLNDRYQFPLEVAGIILQSSSFEHRVGGVRIDGFVLDLARIFEDFVTAGLRDTLPAVLPGSTVESQYRTWLDQDAKVDLRPDVVWLDSGLRPVAVVDAKYKAERASGFPNADIYQALAYATALGLDEAHLVYAKGNAEAQSFTVIGTGTVIIAHALDLALPPAHVLGQVHGLAHRLAGMDES